MRGVWEECFLWTYPIGLGSILRGEAVRELARAQHSTQRQSSRHTGQTEGKTAMSNGNAEQLHPLQNTWCIWEHKVRFVVALSAIISGAVPWHTLVAAVADACFLIAAGGGWGVGIGRALLSRALCVPFSSTRS